MQFYLQPIGELPHGKLVKSVSLDQLFSGVNNDFFVQSLMEHISNPDAVSIIS